MRSKAKKQRQAEEAAEAAEEAAAEAKAEAAAELEAKQAHVAEVAEHKVELVVSALKDRLATDADVQTVEFGIIHNPDKPELHRLGIYKQSKVTGRWSGLTVEFAKSKLRVGAAALAELVLAQPFEAMNTLPVVRVIE